MAIKYDVAFINPFLEAVVNVLSTMAMVSATPGRPYINTRRTAQCDVTGLIGITGHAEGTIALSLSKGAILRIVSNMIGEEYTDLNNDIADAVGELTNMISGQARQNLSTMGLNFRASTPSVVIGKGLRVAHPASGPILAIPFTTADGDLVVEICFVRTQAVAVGKEVAPQAPAPGTQAAAPEAQPATPAPDPGQKQEKMDQNAIDKFFD
jgi:chemotaxis protein CheX